MKKNIQRDIFNETMNISEDMFAKKSKRMVNQIIDKIVTEDNNKILDIGCSTGEFLNLYCDRNYCYGIDISDESLNMIDKLKINVSVCDIDHENLPFDDNFFDIVYSSNTIEHIIDTHHFMEEIYRCLKPDGRLIIVCPNINQPISLLMQIFLDLPPRGSARPYSAHVRDFSLRILKKTFEIHNFKIVKVYGFGIYPFMGKISNIFLKIFPRAAEQIIIYGIKKPVAAKPKRIYDDVRKLLNN